MFFEIGRQATFDQKLWMEEERKQLQEPSKTQSESALLITTITIL